MYEIVPVSVSDCGYILTPNKLERSKREIATYLGKWNPGMFMAPFRPIVTTKARNIVTKRILDMPIKFPGSNDYKIPHEFENLLAEIQNIIDFETANNSLIDDYYAYLTTDYSYCIAGNSQRKGGCHVDGYQGVRTSKDELINRSYVYCSREPIEFFIQPFPICHIDDSKYNIFKYMDKIAEEQYLWKPEPFDVVLSNVYNVHRSPIIQEEGYRFFFRLSFDVRKFDRLGNTHNSMFDYKWEMVARDTQTTLLEYPG